MQVAAPLRSRDRSVVIAAWVATVAIVGILYTVIVVIPHLGLDRDGEIGSGFVLPLAATAIVALLLPRIRRWTGRAARRALLGHHAEPYEVLSQLTASLSTPSTETDVDLVEMLGRGTGAETATIWTNDASDLGPQPLEHWPVTTPISSASSEELLARDDLAFQLVTHRGETLGAVTITKPGSSIGDAEGDLLSDVAAGLALTLRNRQLVSTLEARATEVRASRRRLIETHDQERRRLERDLHDGAQQHLIALRVKLGLAATMAERQGHPELVANIGELVDVAQDAVASMRQVAHGIYPPLLESKGLASALQGVAGSARAGLSVDVATAERYDRATEETVYFVVVELARRAVEAGATGIAVSVNAGDGELIAQVRHDGDEANLGASTIADRVEAARGKLGITRTQGRVVTEISLPATQRVPTL